MRVLRIIRHDGRIEGLKVGDDFELPGLHDRSWLHIPPHGGMQGGGAVYLETVSSLALIDEEEIA